MVRHHMCHQRTRCIVYTTLVKSLEDMKCVSYQGKRVEIIHIAASRGLNCTSDWSGQSPPHIILV